MTTGRINQVAFRSYASYDSFAPRLPPPLQVPRPRPLHGWSDVRSARSGHTGPIRATHSHRVCASRFPSIRPTSRHRSTVVRPTTLCYAPFESSARRSNSQDRQVSIITRMSCPNSSTRPCTSRSTVTSFHRNVPHHVSSLTTPIVPKGSEERQT